MTHNPDRAGARVHDDAGNQFRSFTEREFSEWLTFYGVLWEYEPRRIGKYLPDFRVYSSSYELFIEIKPFVFFHEVIFALKSCKEHRESLLVVCPDDGDWVTCAYMESGVLVFDTLEWEKVRPIYFDHQTNQIGFY